MLLEGGGEGRWQWTDPVQIDTPAGPLSLSRMKVSDDSTVILTEPRAVTAPDEAAFTDLIPRGARGEAE